MKLLKIYVLYSYIKYASNDIINGAIDWFNEWFVRLYIMVWMSWLWFRWHVQWSEMWWLVSNIKIPDMVYRIRQVWTIPMATLVHSLLILLLVRESVVVVVATKSNSGPPMVRQSRWMWFKQRPMTHRNVCISFWCRPVTARSVATEWPTCLAYRPKASAWDPRSSDWKEWHWACLLWCPLCLSRRWIVCRTLEWSESWIECRYCCRSVQWMRSRCRVPKGISGLRCFHCKRRPMQRSSD